MKITKKHKVIIAMAVILCIIISSVSFEKSSKLSDTSVSPYASSTSNQLHSAITITNIFENIACNSSIKVQEFSRTAPLLVKDNLQKNNGIEQYLLQFLQAIFLKLSIYSLFFSIILIGIISNSCKFQKMIFYIHNKDGKKSRSL